MFVRGRPLLQPQYIERYEDDEIDDDDADDERDLDDDDEEEDVMSPRADSTDAELEEEAIRELVSEAAQQAEDDDDDEEEEDGHDAAQTVQDGEHGSAAAAEPSPPPARTASAVLPCESSVPSLATISNRARFGAGTAAAANLRLRPRHVLQFGRVLSYGPPGQHRWSELDAVDSLGLRREYCLLANLELGPLPR